MGLIETGMKKKAQTYWKRASGPISFLKFLVVCPQIMSSYINELSMWF